MEIAASTLTGVTRQALRELTAGTPAALRSPVTLLSIQHGPISLTQLPNRIWDAQLVWTGESPSALLSGVSDFNQNLYE